MSNNNQPPSGKTTARRRNRRTRNKQPPTKVIIRHLPPNLTGESLNQVLDLPCDTKTYYYLTGPVSNDLGFFSTSRAYVTFNDIDDLLLFKDKFDGYIFVDSKGGGDYRAQVDIAPFQKVPRIKKQGTKKDPKSGTLEKDADYLKFVESLTSPKNESTVNPAETYLKELENREKELKSCNGCPKIITPLIEYLLKKKKTKDRKSKIEDQKTKITKNETRLVEDKHKRNYNRNHRGKNDRSKNDHGKSDHSKGEHGKNDHGKNDHGKSDRGKNDREKNDRGRSDRVKNDRVRKQGKKNQHQNNDGKNSTGKRQV